MRVARCGTPSGWTKHKRRNEQPCDACALARKEYDKRQKGIPINTQKNRLTAKAQGNARVRLTQIYPELYAALYAEEKEKLFREAGLEVWVVGKGRKAQNK